MGGWVKPLRGRNWAKVSEIFGEDVNGHPPWDLRHSQNFVWPEITRCPRALYRFSALLKNLWRATLTPIFPVDRSNTRSLTQYIYPLKTFVKGISSSMWGRKRSLKVSPLFIHCEWIKSSSKQSNLSYKYRYNIQVILWVFPLLAL